VGTKFCGFYGSVVPQMLLSIEYKFEISITVYTITQM